jgi:outer membrane protein OmpA-like peptidoglycan-associated protein
MVPGATFTMRSAALSPAAAPVLDSIVAAMLGDTTVTALVQGYAQDRLVPRDNQRLSQQRADAVRTYIMAKGVAARRISAVGRGSQTLLVADTTDAARTVNRRVEIKLQPAAP